MKYILIYLNVITFVVYHIFSTVGESWAIFDKPNINREEQKSKHVIQNEEGAVSPWSSDSKEFVNGSPPEWRQRVDSSSGGDHCIRRRKSREQDDWWDTSAEPEGN